MTAATPTQTPTATLLADIRSLDPATASPRDIRDITVRARRLQRTDVLPPWFMLTARAAAVPIPLHTRMHATPHDPTPVLAAKAAASHIPDAILREVYCREFTSPVTETLPPHISRTSAAHARVNSFIRLSQGDPDARNDDADLLTLLT